MKEHFGFFSSHRLVTIRGLARGLGNVLMGLGSLFPRVPWEL